MTSNNDMVSSLDSARMSTVLNDSEVLNVRVELNPCVLEGDPCSTCFKACFNMSEKVGGAVVLELATVAKAKVKRRK